MWDQNLNMNKFNRWDAPLPWSASSFREGRWFFRQTTTSGLECVQRTLSARRGPCSTFRIAEMIFKIEGMVFPGEERNKENEVHMELSGSSASEHKIVMMESWDEVHGVKRFNFEWGWGRDSMAGQRERPVQITGCVYSLKTQSHFTWIFLHCWVDLCQERPSHLAMTYFLPPSSPPLVPLVKDWHPKSSCTAPERESPWRTGPQGRHKWGGLLTMTWLGGLCPRCSDSFE